MKFNNGIFNALCLTFVISATHAHAGALDHLSSQDRELVLSGLAKIETATNSGAKLKDGEKSVALTHDVAGASLPRVTVFAKLNADPIQAAGVLYDINHHVGYFKNAGVTAAKILNGNGTTHLLAGYSFYYFPASDEYTVSNVLTTESSNETVAGSNLSYVTQWEVLTSKVNYAKDQRKPDEMGHPYSQGSARFEPFQGGTLIVYDNLVSPKIDFSWVPGVKKTGKLLTQITAEDIAKEVLTEMEKDPTALKAKADAVTAALSAN